MKKIMITMLSICLLILSMVVNAYAEVTPEPIIFNGSDMTVTPRPGEVADEDDLVSPTEDNGIVMDDSSIENPNPPTDIVTDDLLIENPNPPTDIVTDDLLIENPNPPTDIDINTNGGGTTVAPKTGDYNNSVILILSVLFSCFTIVGCRKRCNTK